MQNNVLFCLGRFGSTICDEYQFSEEFYEEYSFLLSLDELRTTTEIIESMLLDKYDKSHS